MSDAAVSSSPQRVKKQKLEHYVSFLQELKARDSIRQFILKELVLEVITINSKSINEFPLLEKQQRSIIDMLTPLDSEHPAHVAMAKRMEQFMQLLTQYEKERESLDQQALELLTARIFNIETVLCKCFQAGVYITYLVLDDFSDVFIGFYGESAAGAINELGEKYKLNHEYWKAHYTYFVENKITNVYKELISDKRFRVSHEQAMFALAFSLDAVLDTLRIETPRIQKTRIQAMFSHTKKDPYKRRVLLVVREFLLANWERLSGERSSANFVEYLAEVICMDPLAEQFAAKHASALGISLNPQAPERLDTAPPTESSGVEQAQKAFLQELLMVMALGASVSLHQIKFDILKAMGELQPHELKNLLRLMGQLTPPNLTRSFQYVIQCRFQKLLRQMAGEDLGRIQVRTRITPRASVAAVDRLAEQGLTREQRRRFFSEDPDNVEYLLFNHRQAQELTEAIAASQLDEPLTQGLQQLWTGGGKKVEMIVVVDLRELARVTTDVKARLTNILTQYGLSTK